MPATDTADVSDAEEVADMPAVVDAAVVCVSVVPVLTKGMNCCPVDTP